ncbi:hypothetical protein EYF80_045624 [Liparis tanakae]|uniref:Uncharacterized protein n=1 Tax=Liparis tanakae TaxID=230148 RepID=A0A4Z2FSP5_9TELE|nr:hypothetical protein EYF80_045624 [Liparis tanakae]
MTVHRGSRRSIDKTDAVQPETERSPQMVDVLRPVCGLGTRVYAASRSYPLCFLPTPFRRRPPKRLQTCSLPDQRGVREAPEANPAAEQRPSRRAKGIWP